MFGLQDAAARAGWQARPARDRPSRHDRRARRWPLLLVAARRRCWSAAETRRSAGCPAPASTSCVARAGAAREPPAAACVADRAALRQRRCCSCDVVCRRHGDRRWSRCVVRRHWSHGPARWRCSSAVASWSSSRTSSSAWRRAPSAASTPSAVALRRRRSGRGPGRRARPADRAAHPDRQRASPRARASATGPFASQAELRELVDLAEEPTLIEDDERQMIHSVFELGDTLVREVMVPRTEMVFVERHKTLRQAMSLALRSGFSPDPGDRGERRRRRRRGLPQGRRRGASTSTATPRPPSGSSRSCARPSSCPTASRADELLREMQADAHAHGDRRRRVRRHRRAWSPSRTSSRRSSARSPTSTTRGAPEVEPLARRRATGCSARLHVDDFAELIGIELDEDERGRRHRRRTAGQAAGQGADPGSTVDLDGWRLTAESGAGRRNRIGTVLVRARRGARGPGRCGAPGGGPRRRRMADRVWEGCPRTRPRRTPSSSRWPARRVRAPEPPRAPRCATRPVAPTRARTWGCPCSGCRPAVRGGRRRWRAAPAGSRPPSSSAPPSDSADPGLAPFATCPGAGILVLRATPSGERAPTLST